MCAPIATEPAMVQHCVRDTGKHCRHQQWHRYHQNYHYHYRLPTQLGAGSEPNTEGREKKGAGTWSAAAESASPLPPPPSSLFSVELGGKRINTTKITKQIQRIE
jgi:hypothetical protein